MAQASGLSQTAVVRIWHAFGLQPHRAETFKLSADPLFIEKVRDIVGLYLNPPDQALVLCVDEKSQIQALDRKDWCNLDAVASWSIQGRVVGRHILRLWCASIRSHDCPRERVLMVQPLEHRFREHDEALANAMSGLLSLEGAGFRRRIGHAATATSGL
jgi:hypothetical protein